MKKCCFNIKVISISNTLYFLMATKTECFIKNYNNMKLVKLVFAILLLPLFNIKNKKRTISSLKINKLIIRINK